MPFLCGQKRFFVVYYVKINNMVINMFFEKVIGFMLPFLNEQGFEQAENGSFVKEDTTIRVAYNTSKKLYELYLKSGEADEKLVSAYLFDESQTEKDAEAVSIDFVETLKGKLGIKKVRGAVSEIALPDELGGEKVTVGALTQKLLAIFPAHKENYKAHVAHYGKFLMVDFCHEYFIPSVKELIENGNKKQIKKFYDAMCDMFVAADSETVPYVVGILGAAVYDKQDLLESLKEYTTQCPALYRQVVNFGSTYKNSKKLRNCF